MPAAAKKKRFVQLNFRVSTQENAAFRKWLDTLASEGIDAPNQTTILRTLLRQLLILKGELTPIKGDRTPRYDIPAFGIVE